MTENTENDGQKHQKYNDVKENKIGDQAYLIYVLLTVCLFLFMLGMGALAWKMGWIPDSKP